MGCNSSNSFGVKKLEKLKLSSFKHGDKLYLNENELFLAINNPILVHDTKNKTLPLSTQIDFIDHQVYNGIDKLKKLHIIVLNNIIRRFIFNTTAYDNFFKNYVDSPFKYGLLNYEELILITSDDKKLHSYFIKQPKQLDTTFTVLYLHGNTGNIGYSLSYAKKLYNKIGCNILLIDYRGYGFSLVDEGDRFDENTCYLDARAGLDFLTTRIDINLNRVCVIGHSLGGAISIGLLSKEVNSKRCMALVVENSFTSIPALCRHLVYKHLKLSLFENDSEFFYNVKFESDVSIKTITCPILVVCGSKDEIVPPEMSKQLFELATKARAKCFFELESKGHNDLYHDDFYYVKLEKFLNESARN
jgi:fermentation-respiration switch protein FrsA (DUF1100 family)